MKNKGGREEDSERRIKRDEKTGKKRRKKKKNVNLCTIQDCRIDVSVSFYDQHSETRIKDS